MSRRLRAVGEVLLVASILALLVVAFFVVLLVTLNSCSTVI